MDFILYFPNKYESCENEGTFDYTKLLPLIIGLIDALNWLSNPKYATKFNSLSCHYILKLALKPFIIFLV